MVDLIKIQDFIKETCDKRGIKEFDFTYISKESHEAKARAGICEEGKVESQNKATLRCWVTPEKVGIVNFSLSNFKDIEDAVAAAYHGASLGSLSTHVMMSPDTLKPLNHQGDSAKEPLSLSTLSHSIVSLEQKVLALGQNILGIPYNNIGQEFIKKVYLNSLGAFRENSTHIGHLLLSATFQDKNDFQKRFTELYHEESSLHELDKDLFLKKLKNKLKIQSNSKEIPTGKKTVIFSPYAFLQMLYGFENAFNAQKIMDKHSLHNPEVLNTQVSSNLLNLTCQPYHQLSLRKKLFDGEGTPTQVTPLIKNGILQNFLHSCQTARHFSMSSNGHGIMGSKITVGPHFLCIEKGDKPTLHNDFSIPNLDYAPTEDFIYVEELKALHAGLQPQQGSFSLPITGWFVKNNQVWGIRNGAMAGDFLTLLNSIKGLGNLAMGTPIGVSPEIWVEGLTVTSARNS